LEVPQAAAALPVFVLEDVVGNCLKDRGVRLLLSWRIPQLQIFYIADNQHTGEAVAALLTA